MLIEYEVFKKHQRGRFQQRRKNEPKPANVSELKRRNFDDSPLDWKYFLVAHALGRAIDEVCACKYRKIDGMREQPDRQHDFDNPVAWLRRDSMSHADGRIPDAAYGLEKLGFIEQSAALESSYMDWKNSWAALQKSIPRRMPGKQSSAEKAERLKLFDDLLYKAEVLLCELEVLALRAADASGLKLHLHSQPRAVFH